MRDLSPSAIRAAREVRAVIGRVRRRVRAAATTGDLTMTQTTVLAALTDASQSVSDLAAAESMRHQSMATTVAGLVERGLIERRPDPADGRRTLLVITGAGRARIEAGRPARGEWLAGRLQERCTEQERLTVLAAMAVLERVIHD